MEKKQVMNLMFDYRKDNIEGHSKDASNEAIRLALIEANGGSAKMDLKTLRNHPMVYQIIEEWVENTAAEGLKGNEFFMNCVEERNLNEGDSNVFNSKVKSSLIVSEVTAGTQSLRRQRVGNSVSTTLVPKRQGIKLYDEWSRFMAGRADLNEMTDNISKAIQEKRLSDVYTAWAGISASNLTATYYPTAGTYDEEALITLMNHVSAANDGAPVMLTTTLLGARKLDTSVVSESARNDFYNKGYAVSFNGATVQILPQRHVVGTDTFIFDDDKIHILPVPMDKPVKQVVLGSGMLNIGDFTDNADLSIDLVYLTGWTTAVIIGNKFGIYEIA